MKPHEIILVILILLFCILYVVSGSKMEGAATEDVIGSISRMSLGDQSPRHVNFSSTADQRLYNRETGSIIGDTTVKIQ